MRGFWVLVVAVMVEACATAPPPFKVVSGAKKMDSAIVAYGSCVYQPEDAGEVMVHRELYSVQTELEEGAFPVDFYYPPGYKFRRSLPTVLMVQKNIDWTINVSYGCTMAASGFLAVCVQTEDNVNKFSSLRTVALIEQVLEHADILRIGTGRLAVWGGGPSASRALGALMNREVSFTPLVKCAVMVSPLMYIGEAGFEYDIAAMNPDIPMLIQHGSECAFWDMNRTTELFLAATEEIGIDIIYYEIEGGSYYWDVRDPTPAGVEGIKAQIAYLKKRL